ncbi:hypothetical protein WICPIJ_000945 [Wickerhamomyces pijperi]|uniref:Uncharacterized protein n=1 Tax=Wickerhamomyces pijperi TaxID=599730 RepID=A0A9P8QBV0_WICPI|nr:hypothetical protein WICPIJ_000945 [Wickerhamomyces pijperi]
MVQPFILGLRVLQGLVELVEKFVSQQVIVDKVELTSGVVVAVPIVSVREVQPLRMPELVPFEVQVALTTKRMGQQSDEFVELVLQLLTVLAKQIVGQHQITQRLMINSGVLMEVFVVITREPSTNTVMQVQHTGDTVKSEPIELIYVKIELQVGQ